MSDYEYLDSEEEDIISKTQIKREAEKLQDIGVKLMDVKEELWKNFPLSDRLWVALEESKRIPSHEAKRRHAQFIGKLMRDADVEEIERQLSFLDSGSTAFQQVSSEVERWRERLMSDKNGLTEFLSTYKASDIQSLRQLVQATIKEQKKNDIEKEKADAQERKGQYITRSRKMLYKTIKQIVTQKLP